MSARERLHLRSGADERVDGDVLDLREHPPVPGRGRPARGLVPVARFPDAAAEAEELLAAAAVTSPRTSERHMRLAVTMAAVDAGAVVGLGFAFHLPVVDVFAAAAVVVAVRSSENLYRRRLQLSSLNEMPYLTRSVVVAFGLTAIVLTVLGRDVPVGRTALAFTTALFASLAARAVGYAVLRRRRRRNPAARRRTLVLGAGTVAAGLVEALRAHPEHGLEPVGFIDSEALPLVPHHDVPLLDEDETRIHEALAAQSANTLVVAFGAVPEARLVNSVITAVREGCDIYVVPRLFELQHDGPDVENVRGLPLVRLRTDVTSSPYWWVKIAVDKLVAGLALVLLSPVMLALAIAVVVDSGRPVLFRQERVGLGSRPITVFKFRSMRPADEDESRTRWNIAGDHRMSRVGAILRKTSLDELPQLFNILRGEMSLVGPRPERPTFVEQFSRDHERYWARHRVPVGLTGWSQVNGLRGDTSIQDRARYDNYYIANWSLWLDAKIVLLTLREVVRGAGA
jgi:exopolysaccharide biosynthesis polyprenyl glycosylphosphotransferase